MRILQLRFRNLNSLVGEWEIDLQHPAFSSDGIFAITGPTGAGKSTILDALCLALYGRTPRLNKVTRSGNEIMSRHTGDCFAEVLFETQSGRYRCHWSQHRSRKKPDGELQAPKHEIARADSGEILESGLKGVAEQIEAATGMDFERFTRSMLLAQGGFAVFLQAPPDQRAPILEQITGTDIYSRISIRVHERRREEQDRLKLLQAETAGLKILDAAQEQELQRTLETGETEERVLGTRLTETAKAISWLRSLEELQNEITRLAADEKQLRVDIDAFHPEREKLEWAERAGSLEGVYARITTTRKHQADDVAALQAEEAALPQIESASREKAAALEAAETRTAQTKEQLTSAAPELRKLRALDQTLAAQSTAVAELEESSAREIIRRDEATRARDTKQQARVAAGRDLEAAQSYLSGHAADEQLAAGLTGIEEQLGWLISTHKGIAQKEVDAKTAVATREQATRALENCRRQRELRNRELQEATAQLQEEEAALSRLLAGRLLREYRTEKEALLREQAFQARIAELEDHRARLEDGKPCPLCGATEHPFAQGQVPVPDETERMIEKLNTLITRAEEQEAAVKTAEKAQATARTNLTGAEKAEIAAAHEVSLAEHRLAELQADRAELDAGLRSREEAALARLRPLGITRIPQDDAAALLASLRKRLDAWQAYAERKREVEKRIADIDTETLRLDTIIEAHNDAIAETGGRLESMKQELSAGTAERKARYGDTDPDGEEERLNRAVTDAEREERQARELHQQLQQDWSAAQIGVQSLARRIGERASELAELEAEFAAALGTEGFADESTFQHARLSPEQRNELKAQARQLDEREAELKTRRKDRETRLAAAEAQQLSKESLGELEPQYTRYEETLTELRETVAGIRHSLRENAAARKQMQEKQREIEAQQRECRRWDTLHELIGSADGKKYRNFAQGLTFEMMIAHANRQLQNLTDRYLLIRDDAEPLELNVIDNYQAGEIRSTKNLSGGESFIVSLSLALGLSQMAGKNVRVDSLFLDEGFATLDEEALDTALETLAGLQQDGKLIGVISHVAALKERISTQIEVTPHSGGRSRITGPGCRRLRGE